MREVSHTYITFHHFSWRAVIGRAGSATREMTAPECRNIEGYLS